MTEIEIGKEYHVDCPFVRSVYSSYDEGGRSDTLSWKPGVIFESLGPWGDETLVTAHRSGKVVYRVVDIHRLPAPYPPRAFFVRTWVSPDGHAFGNQKLRMTTVEALRRRIAGYRTPGCDAAYVVEDLTEEEKCKLLTREAA